jgi:2-amino-4-hydroxy-6-hydroxymethyldihydropteridine diphosphokinase
VVVALGSNLGDRLAHLRDGLRSLSRVVTLEGVSAVWATDPVGLEQQPEFLNAVAVGNTRRSPEDLLDRFQAIERASGRVRTVPNGPRPLDLDLIFYGDRILDSERLQVPHPRWLERAFVRVPLLEVAPDLVDPRTGRTVADLSAGRSALGVRPFAEPSALETAS